MRAFVIITILSIVACRYEPPPQRLEEAQPQIIPGAGGPTLIEYSEQEIAAHGQYSFPPEITKGNQPIFVLITKTGWRGGPEGLLLKQPDSVKQLYSLLAGNWRMGWTCGYHWDVAFRYQDGKMEHISINESCETFEQDSELLTNTLHAYFKEAMSAPNQFVVNVKRRPELSPEQAVRALDAFGTAFVEPNMPFAIVSRPKPWTKEDLQALRSVPVVAEAAVPEAYDTGN